MTRGQGSLELALEENIKDAMHGYIHDSLTCNYTIFPFDRVGVDALYC